jgi:hypothetical protein
MVGLKGVLRLKPRPKDMPRDFTVFPNDQVRQKSEIYPAVLDNAAQCVHQLAERFGVRGGYRDLVTRQLAQQLAGARRGTPSRD